MLSHGIRLAQVIILDLPPLLPIGFYVRKFIWCSSCICVPILGLMAKVLIVLLLDVLRYLFSILILLIRWLVTFEDVVSIA